jgi:hypothetical protein
MKDYKSIKAFTLVEVMISLFLATMVAFFVYTMMIYSYEGFNRLTDATKNSDNIRFLISSLQNSITYAKSITTNSTGFTITRYDKNTNSNITETYTFENGGKFVNKAFANLVSNINNYSDYGDSRGLLFKKIGTEKVLVSNCIRCIYYNNTKVSNGLRKLTLGIVYDEVLNGRVGNSGAVSNNAANTMSTELKRKLVCFTSRSEV